MKVHAVVNNVKDESESTEHDFNPVKIPAPCSALLDVKLQSSTIAFTKALKCRPTDKNFI